MSIGPQYNNKETNMNPEGIAVIDPTQSDEGYDVSEVTEPQTHDMEDLQKEYTRLSKEYHEMVQMKIDRGTRRRMKKRLIKTSKLIMKRDGA